MLDHLTHIADLIDRFTGAIGRAVAWLALALVLEQFAIVIMRYVLDIGSIWMQESLLYGHSIVFLLAAAWTLRDDEHVRIDIFYGDASLRAKAIVNLAGAVLLLLPFLAVLAWYAVPYVGRSWAILERSREIGGLPFVYLWKSLIPVFAGLMALQGIAQAIRSARMLAMPHPAH